MTSASTAARRSPVPAEVSMPAPRRPGHTIVTLHGDLDTAAAPALRDHLLGTLDDSARLLILDLGDVSFSDSAGLAVLLGTHRRAAGLGVILCLVAPRPQVAKLLRITGLNRTLIVHPTLPDALTLLPARREE
jgi:anti-anti-sigma factor